MKPPTSTMTSTMTSTIIQDHRCGATPVMNMSESFGAANSPVSPAGILSFTNRSAIGTLDAAATSGLYPASPMPYGASTPLAHSAFDAIDANHDGQITREEFQQAMKGMASSVPALPAMTLPATSTGMVMHRNVSATTMPATVAGLQSWSAGDRTEYHGASVKPLVEARVLSTSLAGSNRVTVASAPPPPASQATSVNPMQSYVIQAGATQGSGLVSQSAILSTSMPLPTSQAISQPSVTITPVGSHMDIPIPLHSSRIMATSSPQVPVAPFSRAQSCSALRSCSAPVVSAAPPVTYAPIPVTSPRVSQLSSPLAAGMHMTATPSWASPQAHRSWNTHGSSIPAEEETWFPVGSPSVRVEPSWRDGRWWLSAAVDFRGLEKLPLGSKQAILCVADEALEQMECQGSIPQLPAPSCWDDRGCPIS